MKIEFKADLNGAAFDTDQDPNRDRGVAAAEAVGALFEDVAISLQNRDLVRVGDFGTIRDDNGNTVGIWKVVHG